MKTFEMQQDRARAARREAAQLRRLHEIATCGLPMKIAGYHYGNAQVAPHIALRIADQYLVWAVEYDAIAEQIEAWLVASLTPPTAGSTT